MQCTLLFFSIYEEYMILFLQGIVSLFQHTHHTITRWRSLSRCEQINLLLHLSVSLDNHTSRTVVGCGKVGLDTKYALIRRQKYPFIHAMNLHTSPVSCNLFNISAPSSRNHDFRGTLAFMKLTRHHPHQHTCMANNIHFQVLQLANLTAICKCMRTRILERNREGNSRTLHQ